MHLCTFKYPETAKIPYTHENSDNPHRQLAIGGNEYWAVGSRTDKSLEFADILRLVFFLDSHFSWIQCPIYLPLFDISQVNFRISFD